MLAHFVVAVVIAAAGLVAPSDAGIFPLNQTFMIESWAWRGHVWAPKDGQLTDGNPIMLTPMDPTDLTQFWTTSDNAGRIYNAAAPNYVLADWEGDEGFDARLKLSIRERTSQQLWFSYTGDPVNEEWFQINAMSPQHYCVRGHNRGLPLILFPCSEEHPFQKWVLNRNNTIPTFN